MKKASLMGAFFIALLFHPASRACPAPGPTRTVDVARIVDGDTLRLRDGRSLRLIGINAPELDPRGRSGPEPYAQAARQRLDELVTANGGRVALYPQRPEKDRYGRSLVHLFDAQGNNLEAQLLAAGLGHFVAFAPASAIAPCQQASERRAREAAVGLWAGAGPGTAKALGRSGFALLQGRIGSLQRNAGGVWLELDEALVLRVPPEHLEIFAPLLAEAAPGRRVEVRGWVVERRGGQASEGRGRRWLLTLSDPLMLSWLD